MGILDGITDTLNPASRPDTGGAGVVGQFQSKLDNLYTVNHDNWYKSFPYGFRFFGRDGKQLTFFLPINPSNISTKTHLATNIITTLYGTVEEHSEVRYHDFVISGTTGMAPKYSSASILTQNNAAGDSTQGRASFPVFNSVGAGFAGRTEGILRNALGAVNDLVDFAGKKNEAAFSSEDSGYTAFHNLFRYFLLYKADTSGEPDANGARPQTNQRNEHPLVFLNYKDGVQYNVAITAFDVKKDAANPMLYYYNIEMRGYELKSLDKQGFEFPDIGSDLGLGEVTSLSIFTSMKRLSRNAKNAVGAARAAASAIGS